MPHKPSGSSIKRRVVPRGRVTPGTVAAVSADVWLLVCAHAHTNPHVVFRLMMASKPVYAALRAAGDAWWRALFERVCEYQSGLAHSNTHHRLTAYARRATLAPERILRAVFSPRCEACGCTRGHRLLRPFALRVCGACLRTRMVSNQALEVYCGLQFCDFLEEYVALGGPVVSLDAFRQRAEALARLSLAPCDRRFVMADGRVRGGTLFFLWQPLVERAVGGRLLDRIAAQGARRTAAMRLSACAQRLALARHARRLMDTSPSASAGECAVRAATLCVAMRVDATCDTPHRLWFPGGFLHIRSGELLLRFVPSQCRRLWGLLQESRPLTHCVQRWFPAAAAVI